MYRDDKKIEDIVELSCKAKKVLRDNGLNVFGDLKHGRFKHKLIGTSIVNEIKDLISRQTIKTFDDVVSDIAKLIGRVDFQLELRYVVKEGKKRQYYVFKTSGLTLQSSNYRGLLEKIEDVNEMRSEDKLVVLK